MNNRVGERFTSNSNLGGYDFIIIEYNNCHDVLVQFQDENKAIIKTQYKHCQSGQVRNPYHPSVFGIGYTGQGKYKPRIDNKDSEQYKEWHGLMQRGFDEDFKKKHPTYKDVKVEEWLFDFQNYCKWREDNYYQVKGERMHLDKDILNKGNKIYSRETMIFVPQRINLLFTKSDANRGDFPIGVCYNKRNDKYIAQCKIGEGERKHLGYYNTPEEAFKVYKEFKETYIKQVADEYKYYIPKELYEAMYRWQVEITD